MSRVGLPPVVVGNEFVIAPAHLQVATPEPVTKPKLVLPIVPVMATPHAEFIPVAVRPVRQSSFRHALELAHRHSLLTFALLFLLVGSAGIHVGSVYWSAHIINSERVVVAKPVAPTIAGLNLTVPSGQLAAKLQSITAQPASLTVGDQTVAINADTIKSWLQITASRDKTQDYLRIKSDAMTSSLTDMANKYVKAPVDQVTATYADGSSAVIVAGRNGTRLTDPASLQQQATAIAKTVMDGRGLQFNTPLSTQAFAAVTPAAFPKLIEVNVVTKQMYLYDSGQLTRSYPISAGAPATPTPLGEFHIYAKFATQDMKGFNVDGSKYLQPHVHWINYFLPGGYAVHGNYWRPLSFFGNINSSHGCVSLPDDQAATVYNWAPLGTTVITHA